MPAAKPAAKPRRRRQRKTRTMGASDSDSDSSSSSSSESSSSEESSGEEDTKPTERQVAAPGSASSASSSSSSSSSYSNSSSSSSDSESDSDPSSDSEPHTKRRRRTNAPESAEQSMTTSSGKRKHIFHLSPEPSLASSSISLTPAYKKHTSFKNTLAPSLHPPIPPLPDHLQRIVDVKLKPASSRQNGHKAKQSPSQKSEAQKEKRKQAFKSLWLKAVADEFGDELDSIRTKEPTLGADGGTRLPLFIDALGAGSELFSQGDREGEKGIDEVALVSNLR